MAVKAWRWTPRQSSVRDGTEMESCERPSQGWGNCACTLTGVQILRITNALVNVGCFFLTFIFSVGQSLCLCMCIRSPGTSITENCESYNVGLGDQAYVLSKGFKLLSPPQFYTLSFVVLYGRQINNLQRCLYLTLQTWELQAETVHSLPS